VLPSKDRRIATSAGHLCRGRHPKPCHHAQVPTRYKCPQRRRARKILGQWVKQERLDCQIRDKHSVRWWNDVLDMQQTYMIVKLLGWDVSAINMVHYSKLAWFVVNYITTTIHSFIFESKPAFCLYANIARGFRVLTISALELRPAKISRIGSVSKTIPSSAHTTLPLLRRVQTYSCRVLMHHTWFQELRIVIGSAVNTGPWENQIIVLPHPNHVGDSLDTRIGPF
jgi:hypothetical protein